MRKPPHPPFIKLSSLRAIITDVDGTLYDQQQLRWRMLWRLLRSHLTTPVLGWKTIRCLQMYRRAQEEIRWDNTGGAHPRAQYSLAEKTTGYSPEFVRNIVVRWMENEPLSYLPTVAFPDVHDFFSWAAGIGLRLAVVSDYASNQKLRALHLDDRFSVIVSACDDQVLRFKPHPAALECALRRLGVRADTAIYIGDRPEVDGALARCVGTYGVILSPKTIRRSGWRDGLLYVRSFRELRTLMEYPEKGPDSEATA
jgi:FMN phosphatase YigB (HAD superfamily)